MKIRTLIVRVAVSLPATAVQRIEYIPGRRTCAGMLSFTIERPAFNAKRQVESLSPPGLERTAVTRALRVRTMRAASVRSFADLNFFVLTTWKTSFVNPVPPGATVTSTAAPGAASTRFVGAVIVPGRPTPPCVA